MYCLKCGTQLEPNQKFCKEYGTPTNIYNSYTPPTQLYCSNCNTPITATTKFCPTCGLPLMQPNYNYNAPDSPEEITKFNKIINTNNTTPVANNISSCIPDA